MLWMTWIKESRRSSLKLKSATSGFKYRQIDISMDIVTSSQILYMLSEWPSSRAPRPKGWSKVVSEQHLRTTTGVLELITSSNCADYAFEVREVLRALKEENLKSIVFQDEIQIKPSICAAAEGTGQSVVPSLDVRIEDFNIIPGTSRRNRRRSESLISLEDIEKHIGKPISVAGASLNDYVLLMEHGKPIFLHMKVARAHRDVGRGNLTKRRPSYSRGLESRDLCMRFSSGA
nr:NIN-like protein [Tanacetum cinerariifolium]